MPEKTGVRDLLGGIIIVLWQPQDLVNVAGTVRAMKNFGLTRLRLVAPAEWDAWRIEGIAHDTAEIVAGAELHDDLESALADCAFTVAMTARGRRAKRAMGRPRDAAVELLEHVTVVGSGPAAVVFGREDRGLSNEALDVCHRLVTIPTNPDHPSLNLAQAVLVVAYELWMAAEGGAQPFKTPRRDAPPATIGELEPLFTDIERALWSVDFFKSRQTESVMRTVRELGHRADLDRREAGFVRAMAIEVVKYLSRVEHEAPGARGEEG